MARYLLLLTIGLVITTDGYLCGYWTGRWQPTREPPAVAKLKELSPTVGDWQGEDQPLEPAVVQRAGFDGYVSRQYTNQRTQAKVHLLLAWGRPGPLCVHTPEVCYGGSGYTVSKVATRWTAPSVNGATGGEFWKGSFGRTDAVTPGQIRVMWSWNKNGRWQAPDNPRWSLAGTPVLYKLYATQQFLPRGDSADAQDVEEFLRDVQPVLDEALAHGS
jgi:hypothetical protein